MAQTSLGVFAGVNRLDRFATAHPIAVVEALDFDFLDVPGIGQDIGQQVGGLWRRQDRARVARAREFGHQSAMVDVGMRYDDR